MAVFNLKLQYLHYYQSSDTLERTNGTFKLKLVLRNSWILWRLSPQSQMLSNRLILVILLIGSRDFCRFPVNLFITYNLEETYKSLPRVWQTSGPWSLELYQLSRQLSHLKITEIVLGRDLKLRLWNLPEADNSVQKEI